MRPNPLRLVLIEDQHLFRESLAASLANRIPIEIIGTFASSEAALKQLDLICTADVALIDVRLGTDNSFEVVEQLRLRQPLPGMIWVSSIDEEFLIARAFAANLPGFVHKEDSLDVLVAAIETVAAGGRYYSEAVLHLRRAQKSRPDHFELILSDREQEVLRYLGAGLSNEETAALLGLSSGTIQAHRRNIMARLDLHRASDLVAYAVRHGFTEPKALRNLRPPGSNPG